jgi:hypothetical protein
MNNSIDNGSLIQQGWRSQPDGRGTLDIIWSCCTTIFLCCWTALSFNVPVSNWSRWRRVLQKTLMAYMGCVGSEFVFQLALGQWISARRSVHDFKCSGYPNWSMRHAFLMTQGYISYSAVGLERYVVDVASTPPNRSVRTKNHLVTIHPSPVPYFRILILSRCHQRIQLWISRCDEHLRKSTITWFSVTI